MQRVDTEWLALRAGLKPGLRLAADVVSAPEIAERYQRLGCAVAFAHARIGLERRARVLVYVGATAQVAAGLRATEKHLLEPHISPRDRAFFTRELGVRLGYPRCCVDAFAERTRRGGGILRDGDHDRHDPDYVHVHEAWVPAPAWQLNTLLMPHRARLISFAACRLDCPSALAQAREIHRLVAADAPAALPVLEDMLSRPLVVGPDGARVWVTLADARVTHTEPPRELPDGPPQPADEARAPTWLGATIGAAGCLQGHGHPPPRLLEFARLG